MTVVLSNTKLEYLQKKDALNYTLETAPPVMTHIARMRKEVKGNKMASTHQHNDILVTLATSLLSYQTII